MTKFLIPFFALTVLMVGCSLNHYVSHNDYQGVENKIKNGADLDKYYGQWTSLMTASYYNHLKVAECLVNGGANIDLQTRRFLIRNSYPGFTALHFTAYYGHTGIAKILIDNGANLYIQDNKGYTAYDYARQYNFTDIVEYIEETKDSN